MNARRDRGVHPGADERPEAPAVSLLEVALESLRAMSPLDDRPLRWIVGGRIARRQTTLFRLKALLASGRVVHAHYKQFLAPEGPRDDPNRVWLQMTRASLARSQELTERLADLGERDQIWPARILAVDAENLAMVTLTVPGRPLGKAVWRLLTVRRRDAALAVYRRIGRATRLIEEASGVWPESDRFQLDRVLRRLERCRRHGILPPADVDALGRRFEGLYRDATASGEGVTHVHGDLDGTNILVTAHGISLVDFVWPVRFRGYDLAHFIHRLRYEIPRVRRWTETLIDRLIEGYGDPAIERRPGWVFARMERQLITTMQRARSRARLVVPWPLRALRG